MDEPPIDLAALVYDPDVDPGLRRRAVALLDPARVAALALDEEAPLDLRLAAAVRLPVPPSDGQWQTVVDLAEAGDHTLRRHAAYLADEPVKLPPEAWDAADRVEIQNRLFAVASRPGGSLLAAALVDPAALSLLLGVRGTGHSSRDALVRHGLAADHDRLVLDPRARAAALVRFALADSSDYVRLTALALLTETTGPGWRDHLRLGLDCGHPYPSRRHRPALRRFDRRRPANSRRNAGDRRGDRRGPARRPPRRRGRRVPGGPAQHAAGPPLLGRLRAHLAPRHRTARRPRRAAGHRPGPDPRRSGLDEAAAAVPAVRHGPGDGAGRPGRPGRARRRGRSAEGRPAATPRRGRRRDRPAQLRPVPLRPARAVRRARRLGRHDHPGSRRGAARGPHGARRGPAALDGAPRRGPPPAELAAAVRAAINGATGLMDVCDQDACRGTITALSDWLDGHEDPLAARSGPDDPLDPAARAR